MTKVDFDSPFAVRGYTSVVDPLEERFRARQESESALAAARLAKLPQAVALLRAFGVERVWLFGSLTTGATHQDSDVDLMVTGLPSAERARAWLKLEELFDASVDLVPEEAASSAFREAVYRRGREVTALGGEHVAR
jgi:predicted nucleotidyltransferase